MWLTGKIIMKKSYVQYYEKLCMYNFNNKLMEHIPVQHVCKGEIVW